MLNPTRRADGHNAPIADEHGAVAEDSEFSELPSTAGLTGPAQGQKLAAVGDEQRARRH